MVEQFEEDYFGGLFFAMLKRMCEHATLFDPPPITYIAYRDIRGVITKGQEWEWKPQRQELTD